MPQDPGPAALIARRAPGEEGPVTAGPFCFAGRTELRNASTLRLRSEPIQDSRNLQQPVTLLNLVALVPAEMHIRGQPRERACAMLVRTAIMLEIAVDRRGWPERMVGMLRWGGAATPAGLFSTGLIRGSCICQRVLNHPINVFVGTHWYHLDRRMRFLKTHGKISSAKA